MYGETTNNATITSGIGDINPKPPIRNRRLSRRNEIPISNVSKVNELNSHTLYED